MKLKTRSLWIGPALLGMAFIGGACSSSHKDDITSAKTNHDAYHCAMHPQIVSDKPGECPICHMQLVPFHNPADGDEAASDGKIMFYRNPMNPAVTSPVPLKDNMGMDYIPVYSHRSMGAGILGQSPVGISEGVQQTIGVAVSLVEKHELTRLIRATARVALDPGLYSASLEHREALAFLKKTQAQGSPELQEQAQATVRSSELRLKQMGYAASDFESSQPNAESLLVGGSRGSLWVYAQIFDEDIASVHRGQHVHMTTTALPGRVISGTVAALDPAMDDQTRTLRVRIRAEDPDGHLKPQMFLTAEIDAQMGERLAVPSNAILDTGSRKLVYVQTAAGRFDPREVLVGESAEQFTEIVHGLQEGEKVVTAANFLIDSESRINAVTEKALQSR